MNVLMLSPGYPAEMPLFTEGRYEHLEIDDAFALFECLTGPDQVPSEPDCLTVFDFESDEDVDLRDFAEFQAILGTH